MKKRKLLSGSKNIRFTEAVACAKAFGRDAGGKAKPYQARQLLQLIERYNPQIEDGE